MAKIRGVKPDYWTDEDIVNLSIPARLLFIGLWNYACDNGHLQDKSKQIKMRIFPGDDVNAAELLRELEACGRITRGDGWITIPNLTEHQKPDLRYFTSCDKEGCEDPPEKIAQRKTRRAHTVHTPGAQGVHAGRTVGAHGDGEGEVKGSDGDGEGRTAPKRAHQLPDTFRPSDKHQALAAEKGIDLRAEWPKFCDYHRAKGSTMKDWSAALNNWIRKAAEFGGKVQPIRPEQDAQGRVILPPLPKPFFEQ